VGLREARGDGRPHLAGADDDYPHARPSIGGPFRPAA
jgi:hypothetical protein